METNLYAVYGSLRKGWWNHNWALGEASYISTTKIPGYRLGSNGCFPAAIECEDRAVTVEVYDVTNVDEELVKRMDEMEFNCGYFRRLEATEDGNKVWLYVMPHDMARYFSESVEGDDWANIDEVF